MSFDINTLIRDNVRRLKPYSSARDEFSGEASVYLDANENSFGSPLTKWYNRYPDPLQLKVKQKLSTIKGIPVGNTFLGNGSDECIDILIRAFCEPGVDNIMICPPTYGMYEVSANINNAGIQRVPLTPSYQLDVPAMAEAVNENTKLIFICSPNNPTGNSLDREDIEAVLNNYFGLVVIDEAYINFSRFRSFTQELNEYPNLVVLQTLSKAWGLAALRIGMAFASKEIVDIMNRIKPPYNIGQASQELALRALDNVADVNAMIQEIVSEKSLLGAELRKLATVKKVHPSDANFLLVQVSDAPEMYRFLVNRGIVVRDRSKVGLCEGCLRITVGTSLENKTLIAAMSEFQPI